LLLVNFEAQDTGDLLRIADITHSVELLGESVIRHSHHAELLNKFEVGQDSVDLSARFEVGQDSAELLGRVVIRHSISLDLKFSLYVSPWYLTVDEMLVGGRDRRMKIK